MATLSDRISKPDLLRLKSEFERILKTSPTTNVRENAGISASTIRNLLRKSGWAHAIKTNDDVEELAEYCGLEVSAYKTGSRSGRGTLIVFRDANGRPLGAAVKTPNALNIKAQELFGFALSTKKNRAAAMYLSPQGATTDEVIQEVGDSKLNLLKEVEKKGYTVDRSKVRSASGRDVTKYKIVA
jgi:hypothetical protein